MMGCDWENWITPESMAYNILYRKTFEFYEHYYTGTNSNTIQIILDDRVQDFKDKIKLCKDSNLIYDLIEHLEKDGTLYDFIHKYFDSVYYPETNMWDGTYKWELKKVTS